VSDFNGRVGEIARALEQNPDDPGEVRYTIRKVLRVERADGWKEGYSDGQEDRYATTAHRAEKATAPVQYAWSGTDHRGEDRQGAWQMIPAHLAAVVEDRFETGWRALRVAVNGAEVAGIGPHPEKPGEYLWWEGDNP